MSRHPTVPWALDHAPYAPFFEERVARPPGLMPRGALPLIAVHDDFAGQLALRETLMAERRAAVLALLPEGEQAARALLEVVLGDVLAQPGFAREGDRVTRPDGGEVTLDPDDPLGTLCVLVAEDMCLMMADAASGEYRLVGASLCFPSRWLLAEKLGKPMTAIHEPVPDYAHDLAPRVNRVFTLIREAAPMWRINWQIHATPELHLPATPGERRVERPGDVGPLWFRTERQTLTRLPGGAVVFGIRTCVCPVEALTAQDAGAAHAAMARRSQADILYRGGQAVHDAAVSRLWERAQTGAGVGG
jgi:hypothetical protein